MNRPFYCNAIIDKYIKPILFFKRPSSVETEEAFFVFAQNVKIVLDKFPSTSM